MGVARGFWRVSKSASGRKPSVTPRHLPTVGRGFEAQPPHLIWLIYTLRSNQQGESLPRDLRVFDRKPTADLSPDVLYSPLSAGAPLAMGFGLL